MCQSGEQPEIRHEALSATWANLKPFLQWSFVGLRVGQNYFFSLISAWVWASRSNVNYLSKLLSPASTSTRLRLPSLWRLEAPVIQRSTFTKKVEAENEVQFTLVVTEGKAFHLSAFKLSHVAIRCTHHPTPPHPRPSPPHPRSYHTPHTTPPHPTSPLPQALHTTCPTRPTNLFVRYVRESSTVVTATKQK